MACFVCGDRRPGSAQHTACRNSAAASWITGSTSSNGCVFAFEPATTRSRVCSCSTRHDGTRMACMFQHVAICADPACLLTLHACKYTRAALPARRRRVPGRPGAAWPAALGWRAPWGPACGTQQLPGLGRQQWAFGRAAGGPRSAGPWRGGLPATLPWQRRAGFVWWRASARHGALAPSHPRILSGPPQFVPTANSPSTLRYSLFVQQEHQ